MSLHFRLSRCMAANRSLLLLFLMIAMYAPATAQSWNNVGSPDFSTAYIGSTSIAIDGSGVIYVAFQDFGHGQKASVMKFNGSTWAYVGAPGFSAGKIISEYIAIDTQGTPYVAYSDGSDSDKATVMKFSGGSWVAVGSPGFSIDSTQWENIAIDSRGTPYVAFVNFRRSQPDLANVMKFDGTNWVNVGAPEFDTVTLDAASLAIAGNDTPYVGYACTTGGKAKVMKYNGAAWVTVGAAAFSLGEAYSANMAVDGSGNPYLAYQDAAYAQYATVMKFNGSSWVNVGSPGFSAGAAGGTTIRIDAGGTPYVGYDDYSLGAKATVMMFNGTSWVNAGSPGFSPGNAYLGTLAMDACGTPYMLFGDGADTEKATVMMLSPASVNGRTTLCVGDTALFTNNSCYGGWSSSNVAIATVGTGTGLVTAVSTGTVTISYSVYGVPAALTVTVNPLPDAGHIHGASSVWCSGSASLTDSATGGNWISSDTFIASISSSGVASGQGYSAFDTIMYVVTNGCGADTARFPILFYCEAVKNVNGPASSLIMYPNPTHGNITLTLSAPAEQPAQISICNWIGQKIKSFTIMTNTAIELALDVQPGVYFVEAITAGAHYYDKISVE